MRGGGSTVLSESLGPSRVRGDGGGVGWRLRSGCCGSANGHDHNRPSFLSGGKRIREGQVFFALVSKCKGGV